VYLVNRKKTTTFIVVEPDFYIGGRIDSNHRSRPESIHGPTPATFANCDELGPLTL
jgi:hypothetical protein